MMPFILTAQLTIDCGTHYSLPDSAYTTAVTVRVQDSILSSAQHCNNSQVSYTAGQQIMLRSNFEIRTGSIFEAQIQNCALTTSYESYLQNQMTTQQIPALATLIFKEDNILYQNYLGISQIAQNRALAANHIFLLASVSKVITATVLLQLYEAGHFGLDDPINNYLPFLVAVPNQSTPITFRMLLTHTSGIADGSALDDQYYYSEDSPTTLRFFLENYLVPGGQYYNASENYHAFQPGTQHEYSNIGSALIGLLVEEIGGKSFNTYCKDHIFGPLQMTETFWRLDESFQSGLPIVQPYNYLNGQYQEVEHYTFTDYPNGGLRASARDLFKLLAAFVQGGTFNNYQLLQSSTIQAMIMPQIPMIDNQVGLHMFVMNASNNLWGHDGGEEGVSTIMAFNPMTKVGAIILTNNGDANLDGILLESYQLGLTLSAGQ